MWYSPPAVGPAPVIMSIDLCTTKTAQIVRKVAAFLGDTPSAWVSTCNRDEMYPAYLYILWTLFFITDVSEKNELTKPMQTRAN